MVTLQDRGKWRNVKRDFQVGDIVLLKDSTTRNHWPIAKIIESCKGSDGHVQTAKIQTNDNTFNNELRRWFIQYAKFS